MTPCVLHNNEFALTDRKWRRAPGCCHTGDLFSAAAHRHLRSLCQACICNLTLSHRPRLWWMDVLKSFWRSACSHSTRGQPSFHLESFKAVGNKAVPFGLMNKVGVAAPVSRGRVYEALASGPVLRSPTCSGQNLATLLRSTTSNKSFADARRVRRSSEWAPDLPGTLAVALPCTWSHFSVGRPEMKPVNRGSISSQISLQSCCGRTNLFTIQRSSISEQ